MLKVFFGCWHFILFYFMDAEKLNVERVPIWQNDVAFHMENDWIIDFLSKNMLHQFCGILLSFYFSMNIQMNIFSRGFMKIDGLEVLAYWNDCCFRPQFCTWKAILGLGQADWSYHCARWFEILCCLFIILNQRRYTHCITFILITKQKKPQKT